MPPGTARGGAFARALMIRMGTPRFGMPITGMVGAGEVPEVSALRGGEGGAAAAAGLALSATAE